MPHPSAGPLDAAPTRQPKRILNVKPSPKSEEDWTFDHAVQADIVAAAPAIPTTKDLRATWWKVNDQEATGSCVGWATADGLLRWHFVSAGRLKRDELLAPRFIWMASKETDQYITQPTTFIETEGTSLKSALDVARKFGAVRDAVLPFKSGALYPGDTKGFYALASQLKILSYFNVGTNLTNWKTWLATKGPILTRLDVDKTWDDCDRQRRQHGRLPTQHDARRARRRDRRLQARPVHRAQQLGHAAGATRASDTRRWPTRRRRSPRRTGSRCRGGDGRRAPEQTALLSCDLVMKGGITSGVVYPAAMLGLSRRYRFRNIGGASAGAIAAVVGAACEYRRRGGEAQSFRG